MRDLVLNADVQQCGSRSAFESQEINNKTSLSERPFSAVTDPHVPGHRHSKDGGGRLKSMNPVASVSQRSIRLRLEDRI